MSAGAAGDKTEAPTPKRREQARSEGQVAKSADINGAVVVAAGLATVAAFGPKMAERMQLMMTDTLALIAQPDVVSIQGVGRLLGQTGIATAEAVAPVVVACLVAGVVASVAQVGFKAKPKAMQPKFKKINPATGAKNIFGPNLVFETFKNILKVAAVGAIAAAAFFPKLEELAALVGLDPHSLAGELSRSIFDIAWKAALAYFVIGIADFVYQRYRHEKGLKMTKDEVKREAKDQAPPAEMKGAMKRRAAQLSRARMMDAVPGADVVVTNPTHYACALKYDGSGAAPVLVAKGQDIIAKEIRRKAEEHDVPVIEDKPLARSLHATVEIGHEIPEELYQAVAQLLAFIYRVAGRKAA